MKIEEKGGERFVRALLPIREDEKEYESEGGREEGRETKREGMEFSLGKVSTFVRSSLNNLTSNFFFVIDEDASDFISFFLFFFFFSFFRIFLHPFFFLLYHDISVGRLSCFSS